MKKLKSSEINVLVNEVIRRIGEVDNEKGLDRLESKVGKDKDYKRLKVIVEKLEVLNREVRVLNSEMNYKISLLRDRFDINYYNDGKGGLKVNGNMRNNLWEKISNKVNLMNIEGKDVESMIEKLVEEFGE